MNRLTATFILLIIALAPAQQLAYSLKADPTVYDEGGFGNLAVEIFFIRSPGAFFTAGLPIISQGTVRSEGHDFLIARHKKNSDQWDIFSMTGKVGSFTLPSPPANNNLIAFYVTQTFLDNDPGWELILSYQHESTWNNSFRVVDDNGSPLLSDSGIVSPAFDGTVTYLISEGNGFLFRAWKFRALLSAQELQPLAKSAAASVPLIMFSPRGNYRITLAPAAGGKTAVEVFDLRGRLVRSVAVNTGTGPVSIMIPQSPAPVITRTNR